MKKHITLFLTFIIVLIALLASFTFYQKQLYPSICIDPGHGGFDGGAVKNDVLEKDITLNASIILGSMLEQTGYNVIYTRNNDSALSNDKTTDMKNRLKIINKESNIIYISIHANIYSSNIVKGAQVFYKSTCESSKKLSDFIQDHLYLDDTTNKRVAKAISGKYIVDHAKIAGCIVELGFMSNEDDLKTLTNIKKLEQRCLMIYLGILKYLNYN